MEITNHSTKERVVLNFKATGWRNKDRAVVDGKLFNANGEATWSLSGTWDEKLTCKSLVNHNRTFSLTQPRNKNSSGGDSDDDGTTRSKVTLWRRYAATISPSNFNLTPFALTLNQLTPDLPDFLCPTDSRLRPDQRAMEDGQYDLASTEKNRLEEKQRSARKLKEQDYQGDSPHHQPRWFVKDYDEDSAEYYWRFTQEYWDCRNKKEWTGVEHIY
jgi:hypothetical protein